jgi:hypothetical protein
MAAGLSVDQDLLVWARQRLEQVPRFSVVDCDFVGGVSSPSPHAVRAVIANSASIAGANGIARYLRMSEPT